jgi:hypothetical protein
MKPHRTSIRTVALIPLASSLLSIGCSSAPQSTGGSEPPASTEPATAANETKTSAAAGIHGTLLYAKTVGPLHAIDFYEFGAGVTAVHESLSIDNGEKPIVHSKVPFPSLADVYMVLNPESTGVPSEVLEADRRAALLPQVSESQAASPVGHVSPVTQEIASGASGNCSSDYYNDNYGASWFLNNFCTQGNFRWCPTNNNSTDSGRFSLHWAQWNQMEGDFNLPGHITGWHYDCIFFFGVNQGCYSNGNDFDYDVIPRRIESWTWNNASRVEVHGSSQCTHDHTAFLQSP